jgi:hypothetical protein
MHPNEPAASDSLSHTVAQVDALNDAELLALLLADQR